MNPNYFIKLILNFQKASFENNTKTLNMLQEQADLFSKTLLSHIPGINKKSETIIDYWTSNYKKYNNDFIKYFKDGLDNLGNQIQP